jgi:hypothetical protein
MNMVRNLQAWIVPTDSENSIAREMPDVPVEHLLEWRKCMWINSKIQKFACLDGWKAFVINFEKRSTGNTGQVQGNNVEPGSQLRLEQLKDMCEMLVVTPEALDASQKILKTNSGWPYESQWEAAYFR